jgi:hypothetical protein
MKTMVLDDLVDLAAPGMESEMKNHPRLQSSEKAVSYDRLYLEEMEGDELQALVSRLNDSGVAVGSIADYSGRH